jgi:hypothetical protein
MGKPFNITRNSADDNNDITPPVDETVLPGIGAEPPVENVPIAAESVDGEQLTPIVNMDEVLAMVSIEERDPETAPPWKHNYLHRDSWSLRWRDKGWNDLPIGHPKHKGFVPVRFGTSAYGVKIENMFDITGFNTANRDLVGREPIYDASTGTRSFYQFLWIRPKSVAEAERRATAHRLSLHTDAVNTALLEKGVPLDDKRLKITNDISIGDN